MPTIFTMITKFTDAELLAMPGGTMAALYRCGQAEAQRRQPGGAAALISVTMSDQAAPSFGGVTMLSRWQLRAPIEAPADE